MYRVHSPQEYRFAGDNVHVLYLTQWVSIYQFLFGFVLAPLLMVPGVVSPTGSTLSEIVESFVGGWNCFLGTSDVCGRSSVPFWLMVGYCGINFAFNTLGLSLTKHGGAALNSLSYSMLLPLTTLSYALPFLGPFQEGVHAPTLIGLGLVLAGFVCYEYREFVKSCKEGADSRDVSPSVQSSSGVTPKGAEAAALLASMDEGASMSSAPSFQERLVLLPLQISTGQHRGKREGGVVTYSAIPEPREQELVSVNVMGGGRSGSALSNNGHGQV